MTRDDFCTEFTRAMRFVIQKHDRVMQQERTLKTMGSTPSREDGYAHAQTNLDAAIQQLADHLYDALDTANEPNVT